MSIQNQTFSSPETIEAGEKQRKAMYVKPRLQRIDVQNTQAGGTQVTEGLGTKNGS